VDSAGLGLHALFGVCGAVRRTDVLSRALKEVWRCWELPTLFLVLFSALGWRDPGGSGVRRTRSWLIFTGILPSGGVLTVVLAVVLLRECCGQGGGSVICVVGLRSQASSFGGTSTAKLAWLSPSGVGYVGEDGVRSCFEVWVQGAVLVHLRQPMLRERSSERDVNNGKVLILRM
jgi:hypothetical protein